MLEVTFPLTFILGCWVILHKSTVALSMDFRENTKLKTIILRIVRFLSHFTFEIFSSLTSWAEVVTCVYSWTMNQWRLLLPVKMMRDGQVRILWMQGWIFLDPLSRIIDWVFEGEFERFRWKSFGNTNKKKNYSTHPHWDRKEEHFWKNVSFKMSSPLHFFILEFAVNIE